MKKFDEDKLIASLYANFRGKGKKIHDWISIAEQIKMLSDYYGSHKELAKKLGLSEEHMRATLKLLDLAEPVQKLVREGKLKQEVAWRIASIKKNQDQIKIAEAVIGLDTHQARTLVRIFRNDSSIDLSASYERFKKSKQEIEKINIPIIPIKHTDYYNLKIEASKKNLNPEKYISEVIIPFWLKKNKK